LPKGRVKRKYTKRAVVEEKEVEQVKVEEERIEATATDLKELSVKALPEISPTVVKKLKVMGVETIPDLAVINPEDLINNVNLKREAAGQLILQAQDWLREKEIIGKSFVPATAEYERRNSLLRLKTGSEKFDTLLQGGFEVGSTYEIYGEFGSGKSQVAHSLAVRALKPVEQGGLGSNSVIFLDTEGTFRPERIVEIAEANGMDAKETLGKIYVNRILNASNLELTVKQLGKWVSEYGTKMLIIDSIIAAHRAEFSGRGTLYDRQNRLEKLLHHLTNIAHVYGVLVLFTNQVMASPDVMFGDPIKPTGGNVVAHSSTYRIYIRKAGINRVIKIVDSPNHPYSDVKISIGKGGIGEEKKDDD